MRRMTALVVIVLFVGFFPPTNPFLCRLTVDHGCRLYPSLRREPARCSIPRAQTSIDPSVLFARRLLSEVFPMGSLVINF